MGIKTGSFVKYKGQTGGQPPKDVIVWQKAQAPHNILTFVTGLTASAVQTAENATPTRGVKAHSRHRYPGGPGISAGGGLRTSVVGLPARYSVLPGYPVTLEIPKDGSVYSPAGGQALLQVQVTIQGPFTRFYTFCQQHSVKPFLLRSPEGKPYNVFHTP